MRVDARWNGGVVVSRQILLELEKAGKNKSQQKQVREQAEFFDASKDNAIPALSCVADVTKSGKQEEAFPD